jgi:hypothetical protein
MLVDPFLIKQVWVAVEEIPSNDLLSLTDTALSAVVLRQVSRRGLLSGEELSRLYKYICSRLPLIRDLVDERLSLSAAAI